MPLGSIDTRDHFGNDSLLRRHIRRSGKDIRVFTDGSYKPDVDLHAGGRGIYLLSSSDDDDAKGLAMRMNIPSYFPRFFQDHVCELPQSLGGNVLLIELVTIHDALQWVERAHGSLTHDDEVNLFTDSSWSLSLIRAYAYDPSLSTILTSRPTSERTMIQEVILKVLRCITMDANHLHCNVNLHKVKAHCGIRGNEVADRLAKIGRRLPKRRQLKAYDASNMPLPHHTNGAPRVLPTPNPYGANPPVASDLPLPHHTYGAPHVLPTPNPYGANPPVPSNLPLPQHAYAPSNLPLPKHAYAPTVLPNMNPHGGNHRVAHDASGLPLPQHTYGNLSVLPTPPNTYPGYGGNPPVASDSPLPQHTYAPSVLPTAPNSNPYGGNRPAGPWQRCLHVGASSTLTLLPAT